MKAKLLYIACLTVLLHYGSFSQTIRRVNNIGGVTGVNVYSSAQAAHDAASAGDIIYIEPSSTSYSDLSVSKRLTIYGPGFWLSENPNTTYNKANATLEKIYFNEGSQNSMVSGILANQIKSITEGVTITKCYVGEIILSGQYHTNTGAYNTVITKSMIMGSINAQLWYNAESIFVYPDNITVSNNIVKGYSGGQSLWNIKNSPNISNNIFGNDLADVDFCTFKNNIFLYNEGIVQESTCEGNSFQYNIQIGSDIGSSNGNIPSVTLNQIFVNADPFGQTKVIDNYFLLKTGSPALTPGSDGTQRGIFGGASPFVLSGQPPVPIITELYNSGSANASTPLNVKITVRSNN